MTYKSARIVLTGGNIRNHHFYLRDCLSLIPTDGIGGKSRAEAGRAFTVRFEPGPVVQTDVDGDKMILRDRKGVRAFFESAAAVEGDVVVVERIGDDELLVRLDR